MKQLITSIIILLAAFFSTAFANEGSDDITVAIVDQGQVQSKIGYDLIRELNYGEEYFVAMKKMRDQLDVYQAHLIDAADQETITAINAKVQFIQSKMSALRALAKTKNGSRSSGSYPGMEQLVLKHFAKDYAVIVYGNTSSSFNNIARHAWKGSFKQVDITEKVIKIIQRELRGIE